MNHSLMRPIQAFFLPACLLLLLGCGDGREKASGSVTLDGAPLPSGNIRFIALDGTEGGSTGGEIENGVFELTSEMGLVPGRYRVEIRAFRSAEKNIAEPGEEPIYVSEPDEYLPDRYNKSSELEIEFTGDALPPFELQSDPAE